jgi:RimJ/RimL family protein N-acetyltransferase
MEIRLSTPRLILRPLEPPDAGALFRYRSLPDVWRYQIWRPADESEVRAFIAGQRQTAPDTPGTWYSLAITLREGGEMIGDVGLHFHEAKPAEVEIGITLSPVFQGRGFAAEALQEVFRFLFFSLGKDRVVASADPRNLSSLRLLERAGMRRGALIRGQMVVRGETVDDVIFSLLKADFREEGRS